MTTDQTTKLLEAFDRFKKVSTDDDNHLAAAAIFYVIFEGNLKKWNAPQDLKWVRKYNRALFVLADNQRIVLCAKS